MASYISSALQGELLLVLAPEGTDGEAWATRLCLKEEKLPPCEYLASATESQMRVYKVLQGADACVLFSQGSVGTLEASEFYHMLVREQVIKSLKGQSAEAAFMLSS